MQRRSIILLLLILWFILTGWIFYYLVKNEKLSTDITHTYVTFPNTPNYNAPSGYFEYYMSKEWWWMNKFAWNNMSMFPVRINPWNNN